MTECRPDADQPAAAQHDAATLAAALDDDAAQLRFDSVTLQSFIRSLLPADADHADRFQPA